MNENKKDLREAREFLFADGGLGETVVLKALMGTYKGCPWKNAQLHIFVFILSSFISIKSLISCVYPPLYPQIWGDNHKNVKYSMLYKINYSPVLPVWFYIMATNKCHQN